MKIYVNDRNEILEVGSNNDPNLKEYEVSDDMFAGWSKAKICCYKIYVSGDTVTGYTPYVDSRMIAHIDQLGKENEAITPYQDSAKAYIDDTSIVFETTKKGLVTCSCVTESGKAIPTTFECMENYIIVNFDKLDEVATVSVNVL